jgi:hypothetical protein
MKLILLRVFLLIASFGWGISAFGIFMPWQWVLAQLQGLGAGNIPSDPMLDYWLRSRVFDIGNIRLNNFNN